MTVLLLSENFPPRTGGSSRWFWELYRRLRPSECVIAAGAGTGASVFDQTHELRVHRLPLTMPEWGLRSRAGLAGYGRIVRRLTPIVRRARITALHCGRPLPEGVPALVLKWQLGLPYLCYVHGEDVSSAASSRELSWLVRRVLLGANRLIANSRNTEAMLIREWKLPPDRVRVLHPGVDAAWFIPAAPDAAVRRALGWDGRLVLLTVGRLQRRKGHDQMLRALPAVRRTIPNVLYAIAGAGAEEERLRELTCRHGLHEQVQFLGELDDAGLLRCYQQCDLFVLPNRSVGRDLEGFGMVLLEAQACGKAVVAGASGGTAETMNAPTTGLIVNCDGPDELAAVVADLLADDGRRRRMGDAARRWATDHFDWSAASARACDVFRLASPADLPATESA